LLCIVQAQEETVRCGGGSDSRIALEDNDAVSEISGHYEIVLDNKCRLFRVQDETLDDLGCDNALLRIQETEIRLVSRRPAKKSQNTHEEGSSMR
jgi:hypothetical protein